MQAIHGRCLAKLDFSHYKAVRDPSENSWMSTAIKAFDATVNHRDFPCLFGKKAVKSSSSELVFVSEKNAVADLITGLTSYIHKVNSWPLKFRIGKPLITLFEKNNFASLELEQRYAWDLIQQLHEHDTKPWPTSVSVDIDSEHWSFSFMGMPLFINMSFPKHTLLKSRNLGPHIVFVINPRENFDQVAAGDSLSGRQIRARIRARSQLYNQGIETQTLGVFGERGSLEIKQYQLEEPGSLSHAQCPFRMNAKHATEGA